MWLKNITPTLSVGGGGDNTRGVQQTKYTKAMYDTHWPQQDNVDM